MEKLVSDIILKIEGFIKKYYTNSIIKGLILAFSISGLYYLIIVLAEYFGHFTVAIRTLAFYTGIILFSIVWIYYIIIPLIKLIGIGKRISYKQASVILGTHFPEIGDKLQNTLELAELIKHNPDASDLILASIAQRKMLISPIPFRNAVQYRKNVTYLKYLLPVAAVFVVLLILWPSIISEGTQRIVRHSQEFVLPPPFSLNIDSDTLLVKKGTDFNVKVQVEGNVVPAEVYIHIGSNRYVMKKDNPREFSYVIRNLNNNILIHASSGDIISCTVELKVLPSPAIFNFSLNVVPPAYTGIEQKLYTNTGDVSVPCGSELIWQFGTANINTMNMLVNDSIEIAGERNNNTFSFRRKIIQPLKYNMLASNEYFKNQENVAYTINVIPDVYPGISVKQVQDSVYLNIFFFSGTIDDDYGFNSLGFHYKTDSLHVASLPVGRGVTTQNFYYAFDFSGINIPGNSVTYYFEVGDNDAVHGSKKTRSTSFQFTVPTIEEIESKTEEANKSIASKMDQAKRLANEIQRDINNLQRRMMNENLSEWERNQMMNEILEKQKELEQLANEIVEEQKKSNQYKNTFNDKENLLEKQKQIEELLTQLMDEEMMKLIEELQKLMQEFDQDKFNELANDLNQNYEELSKQMDQDLELLKRMEVEERMENTIDKMDQLAEDQEQLAEETENKELSNDELLKKQQEQMQRFEDLQKEYENTLEKNNQLKEPFQMDDFSKDFEEISNQMQQSEQNLNENKNNKASKSQQQSSQQMQSLSAKMQNMMDSNMQQQAAENLDDLRQILDNLISFSFSQEKLINEINGVGTRSPRYRDIIAEQKKIGDDFNIIRDSLDALAMRMPEVNAIVKKEVNTIFRKLDDIMSGFSELGTQNITTNQQLVMTSANNLALLLEELMKAMQQQMSMQMCGNQNCSKPNNSSQPQMGQLRDLQKGMKQQIQQMIDQMKQGGDSPAQKEQMNKNLAKMLAQQEIMQQMLNEMMTSETLSPESAKILNEINRMMEENIKDMINGNVSEQLLRRQELILTRMLEVEKSEHERELDEKRKSNEARDYKISNPDKAFDEKEKQMRFNELLRLSNLKMTQYYKEKYKNYLQNLEK